jgi:hypothetical protein
VVLKVMEHVCAKLEFWKFDAGEWVQELLAAGAAAVKVGEDVTVENVSRHADCDNLLWLTREGYLVPDSQEIANAENGCTGTALALQGDVFDMLEQVLMCS